MFYSTDVYHYIRAELSGLGIDFESADFSYAVNHSQGDHVTFSGKIEAAELNKCVDLYVEALQKTNAPSYEVDALSKKLKYFLKVYHQVASSYLDITGRSYSRSKIEFEDVGLDILSDSGEDDEKYFHYMEVDGEVLIGRFGLVQFWYSDFIDFLNFVSNSITDCLQRAYGTLSKVSMAMYNAVEDFKYSRVINDRLTLSITAVSVDSCDMDLGDCYLDTEVSPFGKTQDIRNNELIKAMYHGVANNQDVPVQVKISFIDEDENVVSETWRVTYSTLDANGKYKIADRRSLISEAVYDLRAALDISKAA